MNALEYGYTLISTRALVSPEYASSSDMAIFFSHEADKGKVGYIMTTEPYFEIGTPEGLLEAEEMLANLAVQ
jgi:NDP-sugar pyrophosphorylase family protein